MENINIDLNHGFALIEEKIAALTNDLDTMVAQGKISKDAATWMLNRLKDITLVCRDNRTDKAEIIGSHHISF